MSQISFSELMIKELPKVEYLIEPIIPKRGLVYVYGPPGSFKTNFLLYMSMLGINNNKVFDFNIKPFRTLWIDEENGLIGMKDKIQKISESNTIDVNTNNNQILSFNDFKILNSGWISRIDNLITEHKVNLIVIDSIAKVFDGDERNEKEVAKIFDILKGIIDNREVCFVIIHHSRKFDKQRSGEIDDISGSREFAAMADSMLYLQHVNKSKYLLKHTKSRYSVNADSINFSVNDNLAIVYEGTATEGFQRIVERIKPIILEFMKEDEWYETGTIVKSMESEGYKRSSIIQSLNELKKTHCVEKNYGKYKKSRI